MWHRLRRLVAVLSLGAAALLTCEGAAPAPPFVAEHDREQRLIGEDAPPPADPPPIFCARALAPAPDATIVKKVVARLYPSPPRLTALGAR